MAIYLVHLIFLQSTVRALHSVPINVLSQILFVVRDGIVDVQFTPLHILVGAEVTILNFPVTFSINFLRCFLG